MGLDPLSWWEVTSHLINPAIAYALALPIGWDREWEERSAGIRTFPLIAVANCGFVLIAIRVLGEGSFGRARILEGRITGVGFIGGGAILKHAGSEKPADHVSASPVGSRTRRYFTSIHTSLAP